MKNTVLGPYIEDDSRVIEVEGLSIIIGIEFTIGGI